MSSRSNQPRVSSTAISGGAYAGSISTTSRVSAGSAWKWRHEAFIQTGVGSLGTRSTADMLQTFTGTVGPVRDRPRAASSASIHASASAYQDARNQSGRRAGDGSDPDTTSAITRRVADAAESISAISSSAVHVPSTAVFVRDANTFISRCPSALTGSCGATRTADGSPQVRARRSRSIHGWSSTYVGSRPSSSVRTRPSRSSTHSCRTGVGSGTGFSSSRLPRVCLTHVSQGSAPCHGGMDGGDGIRSRHVLSIPRWWVSRGSRVGYVSTVDEGPGPRCGGQPDRMP